MVVLTAGPLTGGRRVVAAARRSRPAADRIVDGEGLSPTELRALMDCAALFVGGDSGPLHMAATSDVPVVGLFGPTLVNGRRRGGRQTPTISIDGGELPCRPAINACACPATIAASAASPPTAPAAARQLLETTR